MINSSRLEKVKEMEDNIIKEMRNFFDLKEKTKYITKQLEI